MVNYLKQILFLIGNDFRRLPILVLLFIASSLLDLVGLGLILPYVSLILDPVSISENFFFRKVNIFYPNINQKEFIFLVGLILIGVFFVKVCFALFVNWKILRFSYDKGAKIRTSLMQKYQNMSLCEYLNKNSADCINSIQVLSTQFAQNTLVATLRFTSDGILLSAILLFLFWTNPLALLVLTGLLASVVFFYDRIFKSKITGYGKKTTLCQSNLVKGTNESLQGLKEIRILGVEPFFFEKVQTSAHEYAKYFARTQVLSVAPRYILEFCLILFIVLMVFITLQSGALLNSIIPTLSVFAVSSLRLIPAANSISNGISQMRFGRFATQVIYNDLSSLIESMDNDPNLHCNDREPFKSLELRDVSFRYPSSKVFTLNNVSLSITSGEIIGLMGSTGSGKTTLINVMLGLLESFDGNVLINGENVSGNSSIIRKNVAYLPQQIFLTDDSLRNNIALGENPNEISDEKIFEVLSKVRLTEFVKGLPHGLDTLIGEKGMRLSGGQCQRVALARSLYYERSLLVLDEATSALDVDTEKLIIDELKELKGEKTIVMIAHRLSSLKYCDRIYRFNDDRSLTLINYDELMSNQI